MVLDVAQSLPLHPQSCRFQAWVCARSTSFQQSAHGVTQRPAGGSEGPRDGNWEASGRECFTTSSPPRGLVSEPLPNYFMLKVRALGWMRVGRGDEEVSAVSPRSLESLQKRPLSCQDAVNKQLGIGQASRPHPRPSHPHPRGFSGSCSRLLCLLGDISSLLAEVEAAGLQSCEINCMPALESGSASSRDELCPLGSAQKGTL